VTDDGSAQRKRDIRTALEEAKAVARALSLHAESVLGRGTARFFGIAGAFAAAVVIILMFLDWYIAPETPGERKDLILTLAQILGGTALLSGLYFTWRTLQVNREGQITDRFTHAIDQLGDTSDGKPRLEIRLGGIYALERIARDSPTRDHGTVMEVLTAYVRENSPWPARNDRAPKDDSLRDSVTSEAAEQDSERELEVENTPHHFPTDIQAILDVLRRRDEDRVPEPLRSPLDLQDVDLRGANLDEAHLEKALLRRANLDGASLVDANLQDALLRDAHLEGAFLHGANLERAHLVRVNLKGATLTQTYLKGANFADANLEGAYLVAADMQGTRLWGANVKGAFLHGANLEGANLSGANLEGTYLLPEQIEWTLGDEQTKLPEHLVDHRPRLWSKSLEEQVDIIMRWREHKQAST
jgi:uncharacterized protein YjbI with pentapeptide repeats